jgi:methionyl aminopeptidase
VGLFFNSNTKSELEIKLIKESSLLVGKTLAEVARVIKPGVTTKHLDEVAEEFILKNGAKPSFKGYNGFPATLCVSVNDAVVHGIPNDYVIKDGDIVSVDCGVVKNGYHGDYAYTFAIGNVKSEYLDLIAKTKESLYKGIEMAIDGNYIGDIGYAIQSYVEKHGYSVVRELVGHGIGRSLHEKPEVPNYGTPQKGPRLKEGMVICIEPMINYGRRNVIFENDGWTVRTADRKPSAHFEHQVVVRKDKAEIISTYEYIEQEIERKING